MTTKTRPHPLLFFLLISSFANFLNSCTPTSKHKSLEFDHIVLFVKDPALKDSLDVLFTPAEKLHTQHTSQGTSGHYYLFFNTFVELLFLEDSSKAEHNKANFGSDYLARWNPNGQSSPVGFGMSWAEWDTSAITQDFHKYVNKDSPNGEYYLMSKHNIDASQPMIYVSMPHRKYKSLKSLDETENRPMEIRDDLKRYLTHPSKVKKITEITYTYSNGDWIGNHNFFTDTTSNLQFKKADSASLKMVFDESPKNRKTFNLNDHFSLIIEF